MIKFDNNEKDKKDWEEFIRDPKNIGCTILMRYTLRLLTSDQFSRLTGLVLAVEKIRKEKYL